ncbi:thioesterase II family protein [Actinoplanes sp. G11-F43]|uniref:thioesterase II family protein n=1 Tax=Actinoplanes sp. G11-F43 TaxID=3424130 RepID=UPI003D33EB6F
MTWLLRRRPRPRAPLRMYVFPHSGGTPGEYLRWADALPDVEVHGVQFPGRGGRYTEAPFTRMAPAVAALLAAVEFRAPFVFFGHSLGALVAYETALALRAAGRPQPLRLYASAYRAPHLHDPGPDLSGLAGAALVAAIERDHGPLPAIVKDDPELLEMTLPVLQADLGIVASYRYAPRPPLDCPVSVLGGAGDHETPEQLAAWDRHTTAGADVRLFPGGHFYFRERDDDLLQHLAERSHDDLSRTRTVESPDALP